MQTNGTLSFNLPEGWTLRKVVTAMVQEWLPPFRVEPALKTARWVVQSVMEGGDKSTSSLWEPGISTEEYESRLDRLINSWVIRATAGRGKGIILARLAVDEEQPGILKLTSSDAPLPERLFDEERLSELQESQGTEGSTGVFAALLLQNGFQCITPTEVH